MRETLLRWDGAWVGKKHRSVWKAAPLCLFSSVSKARNNIAFDDEVLSLQRLKAFLFFGFGLRPNCL